MNDTYLLGFGGFLAGLAVGSAALYLLLKYRVEMVRKGSDFLILRLPFWGEISTRFRVRHSGLFIEEWQEWQKKIERLARLVEPEVLYRYVTTFGINYVGLEGDREDGSWSKGKLAYAILTCCYRDGFRGWGYNVFLNPELDLQQVSRNLSRHLAERIHPAEVQTFLFLHEIGHTAKAGNQSYFSALVNHSLAGGKRSGPMRRRLRLLRNEIERYADEFALRELKQLRAQRSSGK